MNPNIIFLLIDGFRADRCYGKQKTAYTPNIDKLIESGTYFTQVISPADGTTLSLNGIFNGVYPFRTGTRQKKMFLEELYSSCTFERTSLIKEKVFLKRILLKSVS